MEKITEKKTWNSISTNKKLYYTAHLTCILSLVSVLRLLSSQQLFWEVIHLLKPTLQHIFCDHKTSVAGMADSPLFHNEIPGYSEIQSPLGWLNFLWWSYLLLSHSKNLLYVFLSLCPYFRGKFCLGHFLCIFHLKSDGFLKTLFSAL